MLFFAQMPRKDVEKPKGRLSELDQAVNDFDAILISPIFDSQVVSDRLAQVQSRALLSGLSPIDTYRKLETQALRASRKAAELNDPSESKFTEMANSFRAGIDMLSPKPQKPPQVSHLATSDAKG